MYHSERNGTSTYIESICWRIFSQEVENIKSKNFHMTTVLLYCLSIDVIDSIGGEGVFSKKNIGIVVAIVLVLMIVMLMQERSAMNENLVVAVGQESYSTNDAFMSGIEVSSDCEGADAIIYMSNYGTFYRHDNSGAVEKLGYTVRAGCGEKIYWIPNKIDVGKKVGRAIRVRSVKGVDAFLAYADIQVSRTDNSFVPEVIYLGRD